MPSVWIPRQQILDNPDLQAFEIELCRRFPIYFMIRWLYTKDEVNKTDRVRQFPNYAHIHRAVDIFETEDFVLVPKSRRMQISWTCLGYCLWTALFNEYSRVMIQSIKEKTAEKLIRKVEFMIEQLPLFFFAGKKMTRGTEILKLELMFPNGSIIEGVQQGAEHLRGDTVTLWFCDEGAIQPLLEDAWIGSRPSLTGGGKAIIVSSVKPSYFWDLVNDVSEISVGAYMDEVEKYEPFKGIKEHRNTNNGFYVFWLHYSADPNKDPDTPEGKAWLEQERKRGYDNVKKWNQEMEIDGRALGETQVYPQFDIRLHHLPKLTPKDIPLDWTRYFALDPGIDAPTACTWAAVSPEGCVFFYDEYYQIGATIEEHTIAIKAKEQEHGVKPFIRYMDPHGFKRDYLGNTAADEYAKYGIYCTPAQNDWAVGVNAVRTYLRNTSLPEDETPMRVFFCSMPNTFKEFSRHTFKEGSIDKATKGHDHALDTVRYILVTSPVFIKGSKKIWKEYRDNLTGATFTYKSGGNDG